MTTRFVTAALLMATLSLPAWAQRGGGHGGGGSVGHSGGFAGHSMSFSGHIAAAPRASFASTRRPGFMGTPQFSVSRLPAARPDLRIAGKGAIALYYNGRGAYAASRYRRPYLPLYGGVGWYGSDCINFDCGNYDDSSYAASQAPGDYPDVQYAAPPVQQADAVPGDSFRPMYNRPVPAAEPEPLDAITLIFKDGRPAEQVNNYILTRTTLYVKDQHRRQIPVDELDLAATQKANKDAGVDFELPVAQ